MHDYTTHVQETTERRMYVEKNGKLLTTDVIFYFTSQKRNGGANPPLSRMMIWRIMILEGWVKTLTPDIYHHIHLYKKNVCFGKKRRLQQGNLEGG